MAFQSLQGILGKFTSLDWSSKELTSSNFDNGSHIFEVLVNRSLPT